MNMMKHIQTWLLITLLALSASGAVSAKLASGHQNLSSGAHQSQTVLEALLHQGLEQASTTSVSGSPLAAKGGSKIFNIRGVGNLDLSSAGVDRLLALNGSRLGQKLGAKIGQGRLPFTPGREGFNQALDAVKNTLKNATDVVGPFTGARGRNTVIDIFSSKTGFTVRLRADGTFDTLIEGATPLVRP